MPCGSSKESSSQDKNGENGHCAFEDLDHSILQQPLNLGVTNVKQILKCIQSGSREIKDIILNECNVIYECKVCVGLFRSLANFMYHKRCYCKKHCCEDMVLFENFEETVNETVTVQPEAPEENMSKTVETDEQDSKVQVTDLTASENNSEVPMETVEPEANNNILNISDDNTDYLDIEIDKSNNVKEGTATNGTENKEKSSSIPDKANSMISRRTREKNSKIATKNTSKVILEKPPIKCAKIISAKIMKEPYIKTTNSSSKKVNQSQISNKGMKPKKLEFSKLTGSLEKNSQTFPKIIFKAIDSNPHAVFQSDDKNKLESFNVNKKFENSTIETKVDNDKLIIVLKKNTKSDESSNAKAESSKSAEIDKLNDFRLARKKRLMPRKDCNVDELRCLTCKTQFTTLKTLYYHMLSLHSKKRLYYPCPFCETLFVQMYGVTRHLVAIHHKTKEQINKLREVIKKKSVWKRVDDVNPSNDNNISPVNYQLMTDPEPEIKVDSTPEKTENENIVSDLHDSLKTNVKVGKNVTLHQCSKCNRMFGRKSSQVSHEKFCIMNNPVKSEGDSVSQSPSTSSPLVSFLSASPKSASTPKPSSDESSKSSSQIKSTPEKLSTSVTKASIRPKRGAEKQMHKDFVNSQTLKWRSANRVDTHISKVSPSVKKSNGKNLEKKVLSIMDADTLSCLKCDKIFSSYSNLRRHVAIHVGWTRFKCKYCEYQAYNKSQCWSHIQKAHALDEDDIERAIVSLVNNNNTTALNKKSVINKGSQELQSAKEVSNKYSSLKSLVKMKTSKKKNSHTSKISEKKHIQKKEHMGKKEVKKEYFNEIEKLKKEKLQPTSFVQKVSKKEITENKKEKSHPAIPIQKIIKKDTNENKKDIIENKREIIENKKDINETKKDLNEKKENTQHIIPIQKITIPDYKRETNYKSVTTSNPTTIILSKKIPSSTIQSIVKISPDSVSSNSKISPIRTSPRKNEIKSPQEKLITNLATRSNAYPKPTPIQIKLPVRSNSVEEIRSSNVIDKNPTKNDRLISEWFPKKDLSSSNVRRDSAPLIIGLVPASNTGVNASAKNTTFPFEKTDS